MAREIFDYSKSNPNDYEYYGFHLKNGRYHIDTKRLKMLHCDGCFPKELFTAPRNTHYFVPRYKNKSNYAVNVLTDQVNRLTCDWNTEYKAAISNLVTPEQVRENVRVNELAHCYNLESIFIPISMKSIDEKAFYQCNNITTIYYSGTQNEWFQIDGAMLFSNITKIYNYGN
mgnify:FL=1